MFVVIILAVSTVLAMIYTTQALTAVREDIVRLTRERLASLAEDLARRQGGVIAFIAADQLGDTSLAERAELQELLTRIANEEVENYPDAEAGFFHSLWKRDVAVVRSAEVASTEHARRSAAYERLLRALVQTTLDEQKDQWSHYESGGAGFVIVTKPVYARDHLVGVVWVYDDLQTQLVGSSGAYLIPFLQGVVIVGLGLAMFIVVSLQQRVRTIQSGLEQMKVDLQNRLPESRSELGLISRSINGLAETILRQEKEKQSLQIKMSQQERLAALGQLVAGVAHEIRTPLTAIKTRVQLWQRAFGRSARKRGGTPKSTVFSARSMRLVVDELARMETIVRKLLIFSRSNPLRFTRVDLNKLIDSALQLMDPEFSRRQVALSRIFLLSPPFVCVDEVQMKEVIFNLLANALEATGQGGTVEVKTQAQDEDFYAIIVEDRGSGVSPSVASRMFDPFFTTKDSGVGLGLSITYEIVRAHRGTIEYEPGVTGGARFCVTLPRNPIKYLPASQ